MSRYMNAGTICGLAIVLTSVAPMTTSAAEPEPKILYTHKPVPGNTPQAVASALINMDEIFDRPDDNCEQRLGNITVEGIRFSQSGATLESFRFTDKKGNQWSVPTNIGKLPGAARGAANSFIRVGKSYFVNVQVCGSGGVASLISIYALAPFGQ